MKSLSLTLALLLPFIAYCCDYPTVPVAFKLSAGQTQVVQWSFSDCTNSIQNFTINVTKPQFHKGSLRELSSHTPLTISATNLTTGDVAIQTAPFVLAFTNDVAGSDIQLTMSFQGSNNTNKLLSVEVSTTAN
jgi:hypothetical protein